MAETNKVQTEIVETGKFLGIDLDVILKSSNLILIVVNSHVYITSVHESVYCESFRVHRTIFFS